MGKPVEVSPSQSVTTLLVSVEDLINMAMGPEDKNLVNYKLLQTVLHILARHMRLLEQRVEIRVTEYITQREQAEKEGKERERARKAEREAREMERKFRSVEKERRNIEKALQREKAKGERGEMKERARDASKDKEKQERAASKERERAEKAAAIAKEREENVTAKVKEKAAAKDKAREERATSKERERAEKAAAKEKARDERAASKERDREERATSKEREKAEKTAAKEKEREERATSKEREKAEKAAAKERDKEERAASKEKEKAKKAATKEKDREEGGSSKDRERAEKAAAKDREREEKAAAKADKAASKEKEREKRAAAKEELASTKDREKEERAESKERERAEKAAAKEERATSKERERELKEAAKAEKHEMKDKARTEKEQKKAERAEEKAKAKTEKEMAKAEHAAAKEQEKAEREQEKAKKLAESGIAITEEARDKEKILLVEKGPTTTRSGALPGARSNIEVVTRSQFDLLKGIVTDLKDKAGPLPMPSMPQNKELLQRLSQGTASLTDVMAAMQVSARVVAAEQAIGRMGGILTQLATAGALPADIAGQVGAVTTELEADLLEAGARSQGGDALSMATATKGASSRKSLMSMKSKTSTYAKASLAASMTSGASGAFPVPKVTHPELDDAVRQLKEDMMRSMGLLTAKSSATAEASMAMVKTVAEKLDTALKVNSRITTLHAMVTDYADQLGGFDAGLTTQLRSFGEQMTQIRCDLGAGLKLLESVNNNAETTAVMELTERYEGLVSELDHTLHAHSDLTNTQEQLGDDLRNLLDSVEMLKEQKADRDEVQDGLRDKADTSRLAGLLTDQEFCDSRYELERRLEGCHEKFHRQDEVWMEAIKELKDAVELKADLVQLLGTRDEAQQALEMLHAMCQSLALVLGEPKAAILTRKVTRGGVCAACLVPALMSPQDAAGGPPRLPAARPAPAGAPARDEPCELEITMAPPPDPRRHMCNRWVGGSHTMLSGAVSRKRAAPGAHAAAPTSRYTGYGDDGRLYMMEERLQPCLECNQLHDEEEGETPVIINA